MLPADFEKKVKVGSVVQIGNFATDGPFNHCMLTVTEVKSWGVQGYVQVPAQGQAYYRAIIADIEYVGEAVWVAKE